MATGAGQAVQCLQPFCSVCSPWNYGKEFCSIESHRLLLQWSPLVFIGSYGIPLWEGPGEARGLGEAERREIVRVGGHPWKARVKQGSKAAKANSHL